MKKFFYFTAALAILGMAFSCSKDDSKDKGGKEGGKDGESTVSIKIDGSFDDWKSADIASADITEAEEATSYPNLKLMKCTADSKKVYFYFEFELADGQTGAPIDILINADGDVSTGFTSWIWADEGCGWDYLLESEAGFLGEGNTINDLSDMNVYKCVAGDGQDGWDDGSEMEQLNVEDFTACKGSVVSGVAYFEASVLRSVINANKAGKMAFGVTMSDQDWNTLGILPQGEEGLGAYMLEVTLP